MSHARPDFSRFENASWIRLVAAALPINYGLQHSLALLGSDSGLQGSLGDLALASLTLLHRLDDTDSHRLTHVTHGEPTKWSVVGEGFHAHRLLGHHLDNGSIPRLHIGWVVFQLLAATTIDLLQQLTELAGDVGGVAIDNWCVSSVDLARVVQDDDLKEHKQKIVRICRTKRRHVFPA